MKEDGERTNKRREMMERMERARERKRGREEESEGEGRRKRCESCSSGESEGSAPPSRIF